MQPCLHEHAHEKNNLITKDSDQPVYPSSMARVLVYPSGWPKAVKGKRDQRRLCSDCAGRTIDIVGFVVAYILREYWVHIISIQ